jgi:alpha-galactosidase
MTAFFGVLGFELDPTKLSPTEKKEIAKDVKFYKAHRSLFQQGRFYRLQCPVGSSWAAWMVVAEDQGIVGVYKIRSQPNQKPIILRLHGLDPSVLYEVSVWEKGGFDSGDRECNCGIRGGDELMRGGLHLSVPGVDHEKKGDFFSELFLLRRQKEPRMSGEIS